MATCRSLPAWICSVSDAWYRIILSPSVKTRRPSLNTLASIIPPVELWLDVNDITGQIPTTIGDKTTLTSVSWTFNKLTGTIPTEFGNLVNMTQLWLYENQLTGQVPSEMGALTDLTLFQVDVNNLDGAMPAEVCDLTTGVLSYLASDCGDVDAGIVAEVECSCCACCVDCT
jgi:hypothetical protein